MMPDPNISLADLPYVGHVWRSRSRSKFKVTG